MLNIVLFDPVDVRENLLPLTFTRPVADLRVGITTIAEKWKQLLQANIYYQPSVDYLQELFPTLPEGQEAVYVPGNLLPTAGLADIVESMPLGATLTEIPSEIERIEYLYDIFLKNGEQIYEDFCRITAGRQSMEVSSSNTIVGDPSLVFIEEGATVECAVLNTKQGPIYIGANAEVMEGSLLRGPIALNEHATLMMGARVYSGTTLGPYCKVGGEVNNVVFQGYSNKAHDGFLGNAVIGEWCNIGAGCVASNLKNNYTPIKLWNYPAHRFLKTGLQFCGLIMGDHSRAGINTMFNTATVIGVGVNIYEAGFPRNFVASFSSGSSSAGFEDVSLDTFIDGARRMMARRGIVLTEADERMFKAIQAVAESYK